MKPLLFLLLASATSTLWADVPGSPRLTDYSRLWTDSPFTSKPPEPESAPVENPLDDYALGGISKLSNGYYAILINRENPNEKIVISPESENEFEIVDVQWSEGSWKQTTATVKRGTHTGKVAFEQDLIKVASQAPEQGEADQEAKPPTPPGINANRRGNREPRQRARRPRVVVPRGGG